MFLCFLLSVIALGTEGFNATLPEWKDLECEACEVVWSENELGFR